MKKLILIIAIHMFIWFCISVLVTQIPITTPAYIALAGWVGGFIIGFVVRHMG